MPMSEREIKAKLRAGDPRGLDALYRQLSPAIYGFALRLTGNAAVAEDLTQEVFLAAWRGRESFRGESKLHSWLLGILVRRWRDDCRRHSIDTSELASADKAAATGENDAMETRVANRIVVGDAVSRLPPPLREILLIVVCQGLTYREAALITGEPSGTLKWRVAEALQRLRKELGSTYQKVEETDEQQEKGSARSGRVYQ